MYQCYLKNNLTIPWPHQRESYPRSSGAFGEQDNKLSLEHSKFNRNFQIIQQFLRFPWTTGHVEENFTLNSKIITK